MWAKLKRPLVASGLFGGQSRRVTTDSELLSWIMRNSEDAIVGETLDGRITSWNAGAERVYGYTSEEMIGAAAHVLVPCDRFAEMDEIRRRIREREQIYRFVTERYTKSGQTIWLSLMAFPVQLDRYGSLGTLSIARNLTQADGTAEELAKLRGGVLGQMAEGTIHNLRDCLQVISGHEEMLSLSAGDDPSLCWHVSEIRTSLERAIALVSRLQSLGRVGRLNEDPGREKSRPSGSQPETQSAD